MITNHTKCLLKHTNTQHTNTHMLAATGRDQSHTHTHTHTNMHMLTCAHRREDTHTHTHTLTREDSPFIVSRFVIHTPPTTANHSTCCGLAYLHTCILAPQPAGNGHKPLPAHATHFLWSCIHHQRTQNTEHRTQDSCLLQRSES